MHAIKVNYSLCVYIIYIMIYSILKGTLHSCGIEVIYISGLTDVDCTIDSHDAALLLL